MNHSRTQSKLSIFSNTEPSITNLTSFYKNDKRIIHFLHKNELAAHRKTQKKIRTQSHSLLTKINSLFNLKRDTSFQRIQHDNTKFITDFKKAKNQNHLKPPKEVFKHLIKVYDRKGYKIPNLSLNNNLFDINPLSEKCKDKLENTFLFADTKHRHSLKKKTLKYLRKIRLIVHEQIQYYKKKRTEFASVISNITKQQGQVHYNVTSDMRVINDDDSLLHEDSNESTPMLLNQIAKLIKMINECLSDSNSNINSNNNEYMYINRNSLKRISSNSSGFKLNSRDGRVNSLFSPNRNSEFINFKINTSIKPKQTNNNKNTFNTSSNTKLHHIKQNTFDFMNLRIPTNRSEIDYNNNNTNSPISEIPNTAVPFFIHSPIPKRKSKHSPPKLSSFISVSPSPSIKKLRPSILDISHSHSHSRTSTRNNNNNNNKRNVTRNVKSFLSTSNSFNITNSTNFNSFKSGFGLGLSIRTKYKKQSDLISFAYDKCREKDFISVKTALRILLEKYKQMNEEQIEDYFEDLFVNSDTNVIIKEIDETKKIVNRSNIEDKIKHMYSSEELRESVKSKLDLIKEKNREINLIDKQLLRSIITKNNS